MKFQDSSFNGLKVTVGTKSVTHPCTHAPTHAPKAICPINFFITRVDVYETLCPQQMLVHKGGQIKNWSGEYRDIIPTKLQCQAIQRALQSPNLQREIIRKQVAQRATMLT